MDVDTPTRDFASKSNSDTSKRRPIGEREPALPLVGTSRSECHAEVGERGVRTVLEKPWTIDALMREVRG